MNDSLKVQSHHLERKAYLYIRQSSMKQVLENTESTTRQYALRTRAVALGWHDDRIVVIDSDQGESGASAVRREGFRHLVTDVGMGHAGIVMGLEVSRLARNNADWHRLLEICALADTLILDEDGVYNPANFNDRMLLGLKGTMSEAELHVLKARLRGGILNKARRGEYCCRLPTGFVYNDVNEVILDPDTQVRETITYFFETFSRVGSASQVVKAFRNEGLGFPSRVHRHGSSMILFRALTASTAMRTLHNPRYSGAYAYGRRRYRRTVDGKMTQRSLDCGDWIACIPNTHPGYITWDQYKENERILETNGRGFEMARNSPPREGPALLQGRAVCGRCGNYLSVRYASRRGKRESWYVCRQANIQKAEPCCQSIAGPPIDEAIGALVVDKMTPAAVDLALEIRKEIETRQCEADQLHSRAIERAQFEVDMARRRYMLVDPDNRLVADTLEADWNHKLRDLAKAREERERCRVDNQTLVDNAIRERLAAMTSDFKQLWGETTTSNRERKRMLAHIIEDVTLLKSKAEGITKVYVRFKGGMTETLTTINPKSSAQKVKTDPKIVALVDQLLDDYIYSEIAELLNQRGLRPGGAARPGRGENAKFDAKRVAYIKNTYHLRSRYQRLRSRGMLTGKELAARLGIHNQTLVRWGKHGIIKKHAYNGHAFLYEDPGSKSPTKHSSRWDRLVDRATIYRNHQNTILEPEEV